MFSNWQLRRVATVLFAVSVLAVLFCVGGLGYSAAASNLMWSTRASMPTARGKLGVATTVANGMIYAAGGVDNSLNNTSTFEMYDPAKDTWATLASLPTRRDSLGLAAGPDGKLYAIGGRGPYTGAITALATVDAYDPTTNTWTTKASMPTARYGLAVVTAPNGIIYAIGGSNGSSALNTVEAYDPATDTWTVEAAMPTARAYAGATASSATNGQVYVMGGEAQGTTLNTVEAYDPFVNTWTSLTPMLTARSGLAAVFGSDGRIFAVGGYALMSPFATGTPIPGYLTTVEAYDPATNAWTMETNMSTARAYLGITASGGSIYAIGGYDGNSYLATNEEALLAPPTVTPTATATNTPTPAPTMTATPSGPVARVQSISLSVQNERSASYQAQAAVSVVDGNGKPIAGAAVSATWYLGNTVLGQSQDKTNHSGQVKLSSGTFKSSPGQTLTIQVTGIQKAGYTFDPNDPKNSASVTLP